jgi:hypothetical protein
MKKWTLLLLLPVMFACDTKAKQQLAELAKADSLRQDSLLTVKNQMLNDVLISSQFVNDISAEIAKARSLNTARNEKASLSTPAEGAKIQADRDQVLGKIRHLVARLDTVEGRLQNTRKQFAARDTLLTQQIAQYEKSISDFRETVERQKTEFQAIIDQQNTRIVTLTSQIDTAKQQNAMLASQRAALSDTVSDMTREKNTVYYVAGTRDELVQKGVLVEEGKKQFLLFGDRPVAPARSLDPTTFTRIDRLKDRDITLPAGEFRILSRHDQQFAEPMQVKDGKITGGLRITAPEQFWAPSKFLILIRS